MLAMLRHSSPNPAPARPVLFVHGLFGSARNWSGIARRLTDRGPVLGVDMRNHGDSPHLPEHRYPALAADLAAVIEAEGMGPVDVIGHSMGGKATMMLALTRPDLVAELIVADIAPVPYGHSQAHHVAAMQGLDLTGLRTRAEADAALSRSVEDPALRAFFLHSLDLRADPPRWKLNLPVLAAEMDHITGWPEVADAPFPRPVLFLSGAQSSYVRPEHRPAIIAQFPAARFVGIPDAGHWLHADRPEAFAAAVRGWLDRPAARGA